MSAEQAVTMTDAGSAADVVQQAEKLWAAGERRGALKLIWDAGADREWLATFAAGQGLSDDAADLLVERVSGGAW